MMSKKQLQSPARGPRRPGNDVAQTRRASSSTSDNVDRTRGPPAVAATPSPLRRLHQLCGPQVCAGIAGADRLLMTTASAGLPELDPVALRIRDPAESPDTLHVLRLVGHIRSPGTQLR